MGIEKEGDRKMEELKELKATPKMLNINDTCELSGLTEYAIRMLLKENKIVYIKIGAKYLINYDRFVEYLNNGDCMKEEVKTEMRSVDVGIRQRGSSYQLTVSLGTDNNGRAIRKTTIFKPPEGLTQRQADKLAKEKYIEFSNKCKGMENLNENMRFSELVEEYFQE